MKIDKFAYLYSKPVGNHTLKIMKNIPGQFTKKPGKIMEISWNFVSPKKWEPCQCMITFLAGEEGDFFIICRRRKTSSLILPQCDKRKYNQESIPVG